MCIERQFGELVAICNECGDEYHAEGVVELDFKDLIAEIKREGWKIVKSKETGEYEHLCPECK